MADPGTLLVAAEVGACAGTVAPVWGPADPEGATVSGTVTELETDGPASDAGLGSGGGLTATSCSTFRGTSRVWAGGGGALRGRGGVAGTAGGADAARPVEGSSTTRTSTRRGADRRSGGCSSNRRKPISDRNVSSVAKGACHGNRRHGSSWMRSASKALLWRHRKQTVLRARFARLQHRLHDDSAGRRAVGRHDHVRVWPVKPRPDR